MSGSYSHVAYSMPMDMPSKGNQYPAYSQYSISSPECEDSISSASGVPSYGHSGFSATSTGYSSGDYDMTGSASGLDFQEYMQERFSNSFNPIPLDRSMAVQAQTWVHAVPRPSPCPGADRAGACRSGTLNAKHCELVDLQKQAQARLAKTWERFHEGLRDAREMRGDLEWTQKKVS